MTTVTLNTITRKVEAYASARDFQARRDVASIKDKLPVTPEDYGATGDGSNDTTAISDWLAAAADEGRFALAPVDKTYLVDEVRLTLSKSLHVTMHPGAAVKGTSGLASAVVDIDGGTGRAPIIWNGGEIDSSLRTHIIGAASGTGLLLRNSDRFHVEGVRFVAGADYRDDVGDSGLVLNQCGSGTVTKCYFRGHPDLGIYITGGPDSGSDDDHGDIVVSHNTFDRCLNSISAKRQSRRLILTTNRFMFCNMGITLYGASGLAPGREVLALGNILHKTRDRAFNLRLSNGDVIANNQIIDWGYDLDGAAFPNQWGMWLEGVTGAKITGNVFRLDEWERDNQIGIRFGHETSNGTVESTRNGVNGNLFAGIFTGIHELNSTNDNDLRGNTMIDVTNPVIVASGSNSLYEYYVPGAGVASNENASGTFTPEFTLAAPGDLSVTYSTRTAEYKLIDNICFVWIVMEFTPVYTTGSGTAEIRGLPFTSTGSFQQALTLQQIERMDWSPTDKQIGVQVLPNNTKFRFIAMRDSNTLSIVDEKWFPTGIEYTIVVTGSYRIA